MAAIDLSKINYWKDIKGQSTWVNGAFKDQKEINSNSHFCFPFTTNSLNNLLNLSIYLVHDNNKEIDFTWGGKKISILNFQIDVFLRCVENKDQLNQHSKLRKNKLILC